MSHEALIFNHARPAWQPAGLRNISSMSSFTPSRLNRRAATAKRNVPKENLKTIQSHRDTSKSPRTQLQDLARGIRSTTADTASKGGLRSSKLQEPVAEDNAVQNLKRLSLFVEGLEFQPKMDPEGLVEPETRRTFGETYKSRKPRFFEQGSLRGLMAGTNWSKDSFDNKRCPWTAGKGLPRTRSADGGVQQPRRILSLHHDRHLPWPWCLQVRLHTDRYKRPYHHI